MMDEMLCTVQDASKCQNCDLNGPLMCRYEIGDTVHFFMIILPVFVTGIGGMLASGYGWWLFGWLAYMLFFFFVWEARVLCSHCPYWAVEGRVLHCHTNYGVIKIWVFDPEPMTRFEGIQFLAGALLLVLYPLVFFVIGHQYLLLAIGLTSSISFGYLLRKNICNRCVNFSCPVNHVPHDLRKEFLDLNPQISQAWEKYGYQID